MYTDKELVAMAYELREESLTEESLLRKVIIKVYGDFSMNNLLHFSLVLALELAERLEVVNDIFTDLGE